MVQTAWDAAAWSQQKTGDSGRCQKDTGETNEPTSAHTSGARYPTRCQILICNKYC